MNLQYCDHCGDDFNYDDCGGYRPPCECGLNCASCCAHGACDRDRDDEDEPDWQDYDATLSVLRSNDLQDTSTKDK